MAVIEIFDTEEDQAAHIAETQATQAQQPQPKARRTKRPVASKTSGAAVSGTPTAATQEDGAAGEPAPAPKPRPRKPRVRKSEETPEAAEAPASSTQHPENASEADGAKDAAKGTKLTKGTKSTKGTKVTKEAEETEEVGAAKAAKPTRRRTVSKSKVTTSQTEQSEENIVAQTHADSTKASPRKTEAPEQAASTPNTPEEQPTLAGTSELTSTQKNTALARKAIQGRQQKALETRKAKALAEHDSTNTPLAVAEPVLPALSPLAAVQAPFKGSAPTSTMADAATLQEADTVLELNDADDVADAAKRKRTRRGGRGRKKNPHQQDSASMAAPSAVDMPLTDDPTSVEDLAATAPDDADHPSAVEDALSIKSRSRSARRRRAAARKKNTQEDTSASISEAQTPENDAALADEVVDARVKGRKARKLPKETPKQPTTDRKMLVSVLPGELVEVVILENNVVAEYYVEMMHHAKIRGSIYKGVVSNIDTNLQAAFVNFGSVKNGFLQIDEIHPEYWLTHHEVTKGHRHPPIQKVIKPGQEVLVQVVKEPNGSKGAFLTTWVSLAGRFLVLTPGQEQIGISRKVEDGEERSRLRELIKGLTPGEGLGAIVRTVSAGTSRVTLQKDLDTLKRVWEDVRARAITESAPSLIYQEPGLAIRAVRDYLSDDITAIWVDDKDTADALLAMTTLLFPDKADLLHVHKSKDKTLWEAFDVRRQIDQVHAREVVLPSGGRLVFDQTEALMAIDINSGKIGGKNTFETMALRTNMEAAEAIARQLRLRDVGGQVVIDFIEMRDPSHAREVEKVLRNAMQGDRARHDIGKMSSFGLLQIVRQRIGSSAISISQEPCPQCNGTGLRRNLEWQALQVLRDLQTSFSMACANGQHDVAVPLESELAVYLLNHKREVLTRLEKTFAIRLEIRIAPGTN